MMIDVRPASNRSNASPDRTPRTISATTLLAREMALTMDGAFDAYNV